MDRYCICYAIVEFQDEPGSKKRPIVVLNDFGDIVIALKITSKGRTQDVQVEITRWEEAGLWLPSYIDVTRYIKISKKRIGQVIGKLCTSDIMRLEKRMRGQR